MSSKILAINDQRSAMPVLWRVVERSGEGLARGKSASEREAAGRLELVRREAFSQGVLAGREEAEAQIRPALEGLARSLSELARMPDAIRQQATRDLVHLAISIAARVIHRDVTVDPDALAGLVQAALVKVQSREIQRVRMHPGMEALVQKYLAQCGAPKNLALLADSSLNPGDVFFETAQGALDASVDTQLREIEKGLIDRLER